jgi:hypothetical protein
MIGRIYKLTSSQTNQCYIGSTTESIKSRISKHKYNYKQYRDGKYHYVSSYEIVKFNDAKIELLEEKEFKDKKNMFERERFYIETHENAANKQIPIRTKEELKEQKKLYRIDNYKKMNEKKPCACGGFYTSNHKGQHTKGKQHINHMKTINITVNITCGKVEICKNN